MDDLYENYETLFNNCYDNSNLNLFREQSMDPENFLFNRQQSFNCNQDNYLELSINDIRINKIEKSPDKSDTKSNSNNLSNVHCEINNYFSTDDHQNEKVKIFEIQKDEEKLKSLYPQISKELSPHIFYPNLSFSQRMRLKKEKAKSLLDEKKLYSEKESQNNKYFLDVENKIIPIISNLDFKTKQEIKMIRNRISAQKSRDRKKQEFDELSFFTEKLKVENLNLQTALLNTQNELSHLKTKIQNCERCNREEVLSVNSNNVHDQFRSNGFNNRSAVLAGMLMFVCFIGCALFSPFGEQNTSQTRILKALDYNTTNSLVEYINPLIDNTIQSYPLKQENSKKYNNLPITLADGHSLTYNENFIRLQRNEFIKGIVKRLNVDFNKPNNFRTSKLYNERENKYCINNNEVSCQIKKESNTSQVENQIVPTNYFNADNKNSDIHNRVESFMCRDYILASGKKILNFDEIIRKVPFILF